MPLVNIGAQRARDLVSGQHTNEVDSVGFGTDNTAEGLTDTQLGDNAETSYWKTSGDVTLTDDGTTEASPDSGEDMPWFQLEATWSETEISAGGEVTLYELGLAAGSLAGTDPAGNDGTNLYTRKRIGGSGGIGKTDDIELGGRVKVTFPSS